jgi:outer membrane protein assembly factor BamB
VALIELDLYAPPEPAPGPAPPGRHRAAAFGLVLILALGGFAGSAPAASTLWNRLGSVPIGAPEGSYAIVGGRLYTFDRAGTRLTTTAWSMSPLRRLWSRITPVHAPGQNGMQPGLGYSVTQVGAGDVLLQSERSSAVADARTGRIRWTLPEVVRPLAGGRTGLVYDQQFRPGTEYDEAKGAQGPLYFADDGIFHVEPPFRTTLRAVDLRTGREKWQTTLPGVAVAEGEPGSPDGVFVVAPDRLVVLDANTGAVRRLRLLDGPAPRDLSLGDIVDGLVLVRHGAPGNGGTVTAYSTRTLERMWQRPEPVDGGPVAYCDGVLCEQEPDGVAVLDPATGRPRWHTTDDIGLVAHGSNLVEMSDGGGRPMRARDVATGAVRAELTRWAFAATSTSDAALVLMQLAGGRTVFGVLPSGSGTVQPLGYSSTPVIDCAADDRYVACRLIDGVEVWAYTLPSHPAQNG